MQPLSDIQPAAMSSAVSPKVPQHGLTTTGGTTNQITIAGRHKPLTENELTAIASSLLQKSPCVSLQKKKKFGPKEIDGFMHDNQIIGQEDSVDISLHYRGNISRTILENALRRSPSNAIVGHLKRLSMHKRLGSTDKERAVLLHDYSIKLSEFSDFVVFLTCKSWWETQPSAFFPHLSVLQDLCELISDSLFSLLSRKEVRPILQEKPDPDFEPEDNLAKAEKMLELAKQNPTMLRVEFWESEVERHKAVGTG